MVKDKYLKETRTYQDLLNTAKKYNIQGYIPGQSFDAYKDKMSAEDYETSQKLLSYYTNQQNLSNNYQADVDTAEINRQKSIEQNRIAREKTMQYLPQYLKSQGLGGLGVSESAIISANNDFRNASNSINTNANTLKADLLKNYKNNLGKLDEGAGEDVDDIRSVYQQIAIDEQNKQKDSIDKHFHNEMLTNPEYFTEDGSKITEDGKNKIKEYLDSNKDVLGELYNTYVKELDSYSVYTNADKTSAEEKQKQVEKDTLIKQGKEYFDYGGTSYKIQKQLSSGANEIAHNDDFKNQLKNMGFASPYHPGIPNGTTLKIKCDAVGKNEVDFWDFAGLYIPGLNVVSPFINSSMYTKYVTYYDGQWYLSEKK